MRLKLLRRLRLPVRLGIDFRCITGYIYSEGDARKKIYSHQKVRTSLQDRTLDSMFPVVNPAQVESQEAPVQNPETSSSLKSRDIKESDCSLTSVKVLRQAFIKDKHQRMFLRPLFRT